jgi:DNA-binding beta-propeller fold protein YncE
MPALLVLMLGAQPPGAPPLTLVRTIDLPGVSGRIDHLAFDAASQKLFVAALGNNTLEVVDTKGGAHLESVPGFREPQGLAVLPDAKLVAVANGGGGGVQMLAAGDYHVVHTTSLGDDADNVRYDAAARTDYVGFGDGALAAIGQDGRVLRQVKLPGHPESFQLETAGPRIYVNVPAAQQVVVVNRTDMKVASAWVLAGAQANFPMALDEAGHRLFVGCRRPAKVLVYDTTTGKQAGALDVVGDTDDMFYDAGRKWLYVVGGEGFVDVLDAGQPVLRRVARIPTAPGARTALFVPGQGRLYLAVPRRGTQKAGVRVYEAGTLLSSLTVQPTRPCSRALAPSLL